MSKQDEYRCIIKSAPKPKVLKSKHWTITMKGTHVKISPATLFISEDGSVFLYKTSKGVTTYTSISEFVKTVNGTKLIQNFSR